VTEVNATPSFDALLERFDQVITDDPTVAFGIAQTALEGARDAHERARALVRVGWAERYLGRLREAGAHNDEALEIFERVHDLEHHTMALTLGGAVDVYTGNRERAYLRLTRALEQSRAIGHKVFEARANNALGALFDWYSNHGAALEHLLEALRLMRETGQTVMEHMVGSNIGAIYYRQGEYEKALACYTTSLEGLRGLGADATVGMMQLNIGESLVKLGRADEAERVLAMALEGMRSRGEAAAECFALRNIGAARLVRGDATGALEAYTAALTRAQSAQLAEDMSHAHLGIGQSLNALERFEDALEALETAMQGLETSSGESQLEALQALVTALEHLGRHRDALARHREHATLERSYRDANATRYAQSLMMRFEVARNERLTADALARNRDLELAVQEKERLAAELGRLSLQDPLTGLYNRRYLDQHLDATLRAFAEQDSALGVAMVDIDHFKRINDRLSHLIGDQVLRQVARVLLETCREGDIGVRFGGEEFVLILPDTAPDAALALCERVRLSVETVEWTRTHQDLRVTVSVGVASARDGDDAQTLLARADERLYAAKNAGRNRVVG
jgi:diguanylate cyclase (GGDEF)-like protein